MAKKRILVVDDEPLVLSINGRMLEHLGYEVEMHADSERALEAVSNDAERFDLVIADLLMPGISGDDLACRIQEIRPGLQVVLCSGYNGYGEIQTGTGGIHSILFKPVRIHELADVVKGALEST
jgi:DNA-binding NtrC family response regulator